MLTLVPLDSIRSIFDFLDLDSLIRCRSLCKYMKYIIDHDYVLVSYRTNLITEIFNAFPEKMKQKVEQFTGKRIDFLPSDFNFKDIDPNPDVNTLSEGNHLWFPTEDRHIIILQNFGTNQLGSSWTALVIDNGGFNIVIVDKYSWKHEITKQPYVRLNYDKKYNLQHATTKVIAQVLNGVHQH